ncbi:MAG TPA: primosomal protein N' [Candidatus Cloacimonadota bacterium]|nr:primosomal protein N' [Candidatus Cloacimonadota bacterium]
MYYIIYLPVNLDKDFSYSSQRIIQPGCRVLVSFNRKDMIGISGPAVDQPPAQIKCKAILEVLDDSPLISKALMDLAQWMSSYYRCPVGVCLFAMLPALLVPDLSALVRLKEGVPVQEPHLASMLADGAWHSPPELRIALPKLPVLKLLEEAEVRGEIEVDRRIGPRDKPRFANFVKLNPDAVNPIGLPARQAEAMTMLAASGGEMTMAALSGTFSYSVIKSLTGKGLVSVIARRVDAPAAFDEYALAPKKVNLTLEQHEALDAISRGHGRFEVNLLYGVTGSGKTEVYIHTMRRYLDEGFNIIFLIPEIALTPQMVERFSSEFGSVLAINHSQLSDRERLRQWKLIAKGDKRIVVGARSAVFAPLPNLGLIIVDEEHEQSYKQDNQPRYHGRDLAIVRAMQAGAQVIIGSATPALESWRNQQTGKYRLQRLNTRPFDIRMPGVDILDMRQEEQEELLSQTLLEAIDQRLRSKQQVILFQNRRGYSSFLQCLKCGKPIHCPACDISMYYHRDTEELRCHYCGYSIPSPRKCPSCGAFSFSYGAPGTQKLEQVLKLLFPSARILRLDSDSARRQDAHKGMYKGMKNRELDILVGTQMISKGLDFPGVTLVGIVLADISLNVPDFRSAERTFQLLTQVAGRSGRGDLPGQVLVQTYNPEHYAIVAAAAQDYDVFAAQELEYRQRMNYPPYCRLGRLLWTCASEQLITEQMDLVAMIVKPLKDNHLAIPGLSVLGPVPAPFPKIGGLLRHHLILKASDPGTLKKAIDLILKDFKAPATLRLQIDIDPVSLM